LAFFTYDTTTPSSTAIAPPKASKRARRISMKRLSFFFVFFQEGRRVSVSQCWAI
jgi:hypothetical protein